jgi:beta-fructofuranosidase
MIQPVDKNTYTFASNSDEERRRRAHDPHRPRYHFSPPSNWMNDPNGLICWNGDYHLFYQYNPNGAFHGTIHWGHAVSSDLIHWRDLPIALTPMPNSPDAGGCWSGCAVDDGGVPTLVYTAVYPQTQCIARGSDDLVKWVRDEHNPVIAAPPPGMNVTAFRDPFVWREDESWYMVLGSGFKDAGGAILLYRSGNLLQWDYLGVLFEGVVISTDEVWECPNFFRLGDKYVLLISIMPHDRTYYYVGTYADKRFVPETQGWLDAGSYFYAPQTFLDSSGERIMLGWLREGCDETTARKRGWSGVLSLPRVLSLTDDGALACCPVAALERLRGDPIAITDMQLDPGQSYPVAISISHHFELEVVCVPEAGATLDIALNSPTGDDEQTRIVFDADTRQLMVDRSKSSLDSSCASFLCGTTLPISNDDMLRLHMFLDASVLEIYVNDVICLTARIYPTNSESLDIQMRSHGGVTMVPTCDLWVLGNIW